MVFFTCNVCGEALKKNQVDKHYSTKCRGQRAVSCMDCGKDFMGNDFEKHTKCITENEKYSGKGYVPKVNKGEAKQDRWIEQVQTAIDKHKGDNRLRGPLESIKNYPNIPRKKAKFENFLVNSLRMRDRTLISKLWEAIMTENNQTSIKEPEKQDKKDDSESKEEVVPEETSTCENGTEVKKLNKRERKEERRKKTNKKEKKDKSGSETMDSVQNSENGVARSKKKRKHTEEEEICDSKRKRVEEEDDEEEEEELEPPVKNTKFNWASVITDVLKSKGEITLKKLRKKVLAEYVSQMGVPRSEERILSKFNKKVTKNADFKVFKDRVKLVMAA